MVGLGALLIPGVGPVIAAGPLATVLGLTAAGAGIGAAAGGLIGALTHAGVPEDDANYYAEGVRRGGTLVMVASPDEQAQNAYDIMQTHGAVDIDERGEDYRNSGWKGFDHNAQPYNAEQINTARQSSSQRVAPATDTRTTVQPQGNAQKLNEGEAVLPVVQEELNVGKRQVQRGGARIFTHVTEQPVEQQVNLHEEHVTVDRQAVNRPVSEADRNAFQNRVVEVTETAEEPVVAKNARVVEEVRVGKEATDRTETVRDSVRRSDVQVENLAGTGTTTNTTTNTTSTSPNSFEDYDADFRSNFNSLNSGATYDQYQPVYQYGYNLASDTSYQGQNWSAVEPQIRQPVGNQEPQHLGSLQEYHSVRLGQSSWRREHGN